MSEIPSLGLELIFFARPLLSGVYITHLINTSVYITCLFVFGTASKKKNKKLVHEQLPSLLLICFCTVLSDWHMIDYSLYLRSNSISIKANRIRFNHSVSNNGNE